MYIKKIMLVVGYSGYTTRRHCITHSCHFRLDDANFLNLDIIGKLEKKYLFILNLSLICKHSIIKNYFTSILKITARRMRMNALGVGGGDRLSKAR